MVLELDELSYQALFRPHIGRLDDREHASWRLLGRPLFCRRLLILFKLLIGDRDKWLLPLEYTADALLNSVGLRLVSVDALVNCILLVLVVRRIEAFLGAETGFGLREVML